MLNSHLAEKINERFQFLVLLLLGVSRRELREAEREILLKTGFPALKVGRILDYLEPFEAALMHIFLSREGLRRGVDYEFIRNPQGRFTLLAREGKGLKSVRKLDMVRELSRVKRYARRILMEWEARRGLKPGDVDEALNLAYTIHRERSKIYFAVCPKCGRKAPSRIFERTDGEKYVIYARKLCCGHVIRKVIPLGRRD